jgi:hypothetical protein
LKNKTLTILLSFVPGVGHLYLGLFNRGLQFLISFFGTIFVFTFLGLPELSILLPVIWFYSFFDALQQYTFFSEGISEDRPIFHFNNISINPKYTAYGLIIVGGYILLDNLSSLLYHVMSYYLNVHYFQLPLDRMAIALILIFVGYKLLVKSKTVKEGAQ